MDIVKNTDPSTVTQHGLYMRPLTDPSLHPLVAKAPSAASPDTPPRDEEQKTSSLAASDPPETVVTATIKELVKHSKDTEQPAAQETKGAATDPACPQTAQALPAKANKQADDVADAHVQSTAELTGSLADMKGPSVSKGSPAGSAGSSSAPRGPSAPVEACSTTKSSSSATGSDGKTGSDAVMGNGEKAPGEGHVGWGRGPVSLLGDAAHATIPNGMWRLLLVKRTHMVSYKAPCLPQ